MVQFGLRVCVALPPFFFFTRFALGSGQLLLFTYWAVLFTHCSNTVHAFKNIKNGSYSTIHTFKNYFATVFSVFGFSKNQLYLNRPYIIKICPLYLFSYQFIIFTTFYKVKILQSNAIINHIKKKLGHTFIILLKSANCIYYHINL